MLRVVCGVLICGLLLSGAGIPSYAVTNPSDSALAPPLATKPPCEIVQKPDGSYDVVTDNGVIESWDRETVRSVKTGETLSKAFRNRWAFVDVSYLTGQMLILTQQHNLQNPKDILIPLLKKHIQNRDSMAEIRLEGFEIDRIEAVREGQAITGFSLPVTRNGTPAYRLVYNLQGGETSIPMSNGSMVYVKVETPTTTTLSKDEIATRLSQLQKIKDKKPDEVTEDDRRYLLEVARYFNYYPEYLAKETDKERIYGYASEVYILTRAELVALDLPDAPIFTLSAIDEIGNGFFSHEFGHLLDDVIGSSHLFKQDTIKQYSQCPDILKELERIKNVFGGKYRDENINWRRILDGLKILRLQSPKIILALIDDLAKHIEEVMSVRADIVRYVKGHPDEIGKDTVNEYLKQAEQTDGECRWNLVQLETVKQNILQSNIKTLVDINESIQQASQPYKKDDRFEVQLQPASDIPSIYGNAVKVSYIWTNLFRNSIYAIREVWATDKSRKGKLTVKTQAVVKDGERFVEVTVSDNGIGIPEALLQSGRLFQKGMTTKQYGNGLGLYLIKQTVEELGGTIGVQSEVGKGTTFTIRFPIAFASERTQRLITMTAKEIPPKTDIGEKPYKLLKMIQAGLNVPPFFVIATNGSGEIIVTDELRSLFGSLKKPVVVRSAHKDEGTAHSFSGVFDSYKGIIAIEPTSTEIISDEQEGFWEQGYRPESLQSAYKLILEGATEGYKVKKYLETRHITGFNPKDMNAVVMEEIDMDVFGMFITSNQNNPDEVLIHYQLIDKTAEKQQRQEPEDGFFSSRKKMGGVITYNKKTRELGQSKLDEQTRSVLKQFGEVAGQIEKMFGVQQIELGASKGKVYVFQSRDIDLTKPEDAPRLAHYETLNEELNAIGYGYYHLPILVVDTLDKAHPEFKESDEYRALESAYMASAEKWHGKEWDALRKFSDAKKNEYREELLRFQAEHPEYILVIKDAESVVYDDAQGKNYAFLNKLASKAKVVVRGRNQRAIRHEDWENVELGAITVIPPEVSEGFHIMDMFVGSRKPDEHRSDMRFTRPSKKNSNVSLQEAGRFATGDYLNVLSNIDGVFVWSGNPLTSVRNSTSGKTEDISKAITTSVAISPESERIYTTNLQDTLTYIQTQPQTQPLIVALGTSWIKGYEKGRYLQYDALNPLIGSLRTYCESKGIPFIVDTDDKLLAQINTERAKDGRSGAKVVVLASKDTVASDEFTTLRNDQKNAFVVGVDNQELTTDSYIRLMEMLTIALKLSAGLEISLNNDHMTITKDNERHLYIFLPHAEPMDYERLKVIYEVQKFA